MDGPPREGEARGRLFRLTHNGHWLVCGHLHIHEWNGQMSLQDTCPSAAESRCVLGILAGARHRLPCATQEGRWQQLTQYHSMQEEEES